MLASAGVLVRLGSAGGRRVRSAAVTDRHPAEPDPVRDRAEIVALTHDYCWALDGRDWDALRRDVFLPDAVAWLTNECVGIDAIVARVTAALERLDSSQHLVGSHQIRLDANTATGRCHLQAQHVRRAAEGGSLFMVGGSYHDRYVRTPQGWRIAERRLEMLWTDGNPKVVSR